MKKTTETQGDRGKEDGRRLRYIGEEGRKEEERKEEASHQLSVSSATTTPK